MYKRQVFENLAITDFIANTKPNMFMEMLTVNATSKHQEEMCIRDRLRLDDTFAGCTVEEVNLMEEPVLADDLPRALVAGGPVPAEGASVSFTPFQIVTLRIRR